MEKQKNIPKLRFPEFNDVWEQHKLAVLCDFEKGRGLNKSDLDESGQYQCILYGQLFTDYGMIIEHVKSKTNVFEESFKLSESGDILIPRCDTTPDGLARASSLSLDNVILGFDINILKIKNKQRLDSKFVSIALNYHRKDLLSKVVGNTVRHLENKEIKDVAIEYPLQIEEQQKIGNFFQEIEKLIAFYECKIEKMKEYQKGMLQKMFPKDGETVPEIRFPGFEGEWEKRKISDLFKVTRGYVLAASETNEISSDENPYPVYSSQTKNNGLMGYYKSYLYENAITWTTDGANAGTVNYREGKFYCTNVCGVLLSEEGYANKMVAEALNAIAWRHVSKVGNPKLMNNVMSEIEVYIPKTLEEQNRISGYFAKFDNLITLQQRKLDQMKEYKKGLLQQMFV